jgi:hypothetical protein
VEGNRLLLPIEFYTSVETNAGVTASVADKTVFEMTGASSPRMMLSVGDGSNLASLCFKMKIEAMSIPNDWWGVGAGLIDSASNHCFFGLHRRGAGTDIFAQFLKRTWTSNTTSGWTAANQATSFIYQTAPFWIGIRFNATTAFLYHSVNGRNWIFTWSRNHGMTVANTVHFGLLLHTQRAVTSATLELEVSHVSFGDDRGIS